MFDFEINNPNEYVPESTMPKSAIGKGGLSAMNVAAQGSPSAPKLMGGLQGEKGQAELENMLFPRIRDMDQINSARSARREQLSSFQQALQSPDDDLDAFDHILQGMMANPDPSQVGTGFRLGVGNALSARQKKGLSKKKGAIDAAKVGLDFEQSEGTNDEQLENTAISNLRSLARPFLSNGQKGLGSGRGAGGGSPYRWVPGTGLVNLTELDESTGAPKIVFNDTKTGQGIRAQAMRLATQEAESQTHRMPFKSSEEKAEYIETRANEIAAEIAGGATLPTTPSGGRGGPATAPAAPVMGQPMGVVRPGKAGNPAAAVAGAKGMPAWQNPDPQGRYEIYKAELAAETDPKNREAIMREIARLPANERPVDYKLELSEDIAGKSAFNQALAKGSVDSYDGLRKGQEQALMTKSVINELRTLKFDPGAFAVWKKRGGNILEAFGSDGPLARAAAQSGSAEKLLQGLTNARVSLEKGVQTKDDVERFKGEIAQITDPKEGYKYMLKYMEELANKQIEQFNVVDRYRQQKGNLDGAEQVWQQRSAQYGGLVKRINNQAVGRTEFVEKFIAVPANKKAYAGNEAALRERAEREWAKMGVAK